MRIVEDVYDGFLGAGDHVLFDPQAKRGAAYHPLS
jgi:hypothetical protein